MYIDQATKIALSSTNLMRRKAWDDKENPFHEYYILLDWAVYFYYAFDGRTYEPDQFWSPSLDDLIADDWEVVE